MRLTNYSRVVISYEQETPLTIKLGEQTLMETLETVFVNTACAIEDYIASPQGFEDATILIQHENILLANFSKAFDTEIETAYIALLRAFLYLSRTSCGEINTARLKELLDKADDAYITHIKEAQEADKEELEALQDPQIMGFEKNYACTWCKHSFTAFCVNCTSGIYENFEHKHL